MYEWQSPELRKRPASGRWQAFCDGSYIPGKGIAYGCVFWTPSGALSSRWMGYKTHRASSVEAELLGALLAVRMRCRTVPGELQGEPWELHLDCQSAVRMLSGRGLPQDKRLRKLIKAIRLEGGVVSFKWVPRKENRDADQCAQRAYHLRSPQEKVILYQELTAAELDARQAWGTEARRARRAKSAGH